MKKTGVLVVNLGTPNSYNKKDVGIYLREFLMDGRVIDIDHWKRWMLVNLIIVPFRAPKVAHEYQKLWLKDGSPLMVYGVQLVEKLNRKFNNSVVVELAMRYQNPSIQSGLEKLRKANVEEIIIFPLFPQYASATTGSVAEKVMEIVSKWNVIPNIQFINSYHDDQRYIGNFADKVKADIKKHTPDHILFSYHGIPERHLDNMNENGLELCARCQGTTCKQGNRKRYCYRSACFETTRLIAEKLRLPQETYTTAFQSRLGKDPWIQPYTDATIEKLAQTGTKKLLVVSPSFVADCLETTLEIGEQYRDLFKDKGGSEFHFTESLNADDAWVQTVYDILEKKITCSEGPTNKGIVHNIADFDPITSAN
ncbi:ferrochelatase [Mangrovibacterium diazotrophicum]|uniref:Ferrochelatase n=1 Tax=Mangrovibacterium diazotrophicum TaxID=1261403 RepID=A0A419VWT3_9BACT|nr:ferrochelatase [Mangrovibacterium diazotrophicum]RKD86536.1 ferrochelatase [Mangrovibacterium diazotrophicum]